MAKTTSRAKSLLLKAAGLSTDPNELGSVPEGALLAASNAVIDKDDTLESRRGLGQYGTTFGSTTDRARQLLTYSDRLLRHHGSTLAYDNLQLGISSLTSVATTATATTASPHGLATGQLVTIGGADFPEYNGEFTITVTGLTTFTYTISNATISPSTGTITVYSGTFTSYAASVSPVDTGTRIKGIERNGNFYFTSSAGIRKLTNISSAIVNAGMPKALDVEASLNDNEGWFEQDTQVAYRIIFGIKDENGNVIVGAPSGRVVVTNEVLPLIVADFNELLNKLDAAGAVNTGTLQDVDYNSSLKIASSASAAVLFASLGSLCTKLDADMGGGTYAAISAGHTAPGTPPSAAEILDLQAFFDEIVDALIAEPLADIDAGAQTAADFQNSTQTQTTTLTFTIPDGITTSNFYQIYRTALSITAETDPGDEMGLVYEANPTAGEIAAKSITVTDITPDDFRGASLYTNPNQEGIGQANDIPPLAFDITAYKNTVAYARTTSLHRLYLDLLGTSNLTGSSSIVTIGGIDYEFRDKQAEITDITCNAAATLAAAGAGDYFELNSANDETEFYVWYNVSGGNTDPAIVGKTGIEVAVLAGDANTVVATKTRDAIITRSEFTAVVATATVTVTNQVKGPTTDAVDINTGFTVTVTTQGDGEDINNAYVAISDAATPAQKVYETATSLVRVVNRHSSSIVYGYYISSETDVPGKMLFEARTLAQAQFSVTVDGAVTGSAFSPDPEATSVASDNDARPNRVFFSKPNQPDAVPLLNYLDIGARDYEIQRIIALRDSLFVFKRDGIYRITGETYSTLQLSLFDDSARIRAPDSAAVGNNIIFLISDQGVVAVSDTGVEIVSKNIENLLLPLLNSTRYPNFKTATWGTFYETDRKYILATVSETTDTVATICYVYNVLTKAWTTYDVSSTSGLVSVADDKLYIGEGTSNRLLQERKDFLFTDFADKYIATTATSVDEIVTLTSLTSTGTTALAVTPTPHDLEDGDFVDIFGAAPFGYNGTKEIEVVSDNSFTFELGTSLSSPATGTIKYRLRNKELTLNSVAGLEEGDALTQRVYLTVNRYNSLLAKLDTDPGLSDNNYYSTLRKTDYEELSAGLIALAAKLTADPGTSSAYSSASTTDPLVLQSYFNIIVQTLNADPGVSFSNYSYSLSNSTRVSTILSIDTVNKIVTVDKALSYVPGPIVCYEAIPVTIDWVPQHAGDPSMLKHFNEAILMFSTFSIKSAIVGFRSDIQDNVEEIDLVGAGVGAWGLFPWGEANWGGTDVKRGYRTYVPTQKQRCRFMLVRFRHINAYESFQLVGLMLNFRAVSDRISR